METHLPFSQRFSTFLILLAGISFSTVTVWAVKLTEYGVGAWLQVTTRSVGAALIFTAVHYTLSQSRLPKPARVSPKRNALLFLNGFMVVGASATYIGAIALGSPPTKVVLLSFLYPIYTILLAAFFLGEPITLRKMIALVLGVIGIGTTLEIWTLHNLSEIKTGDLFALLNGWLAAGMVIIGRYTGSRTGGQTVWQILSRTYWFTVVWLGLLAGVILAVSGSDDITQALNFTPDVATLVYMMALAVVGTVTPYVLLYMGLRRMASGTAGVLLLIEPVSVFVLTALFLNQAIGIWQFIGGAAILSAGAIAASKGAVTD